VEDIRACRLARLMNRTAIATGAGWQVRRVNPASKRPIGTKRNHLPGARRRDIIWVLRTSELSVGIDPIAPAPKVLDTSSARKQAALAGS
jgi:hypothetical protein